MWFGVTIIILVYRCTKSEGKKEDSGNLQLCWRKLWLQCMWRTIQWLHLLNCSPDYFVLISFFKPIRIHKKWVLNRTGSLEPEVGGLDISTSTETLKKVSRLASEFPHFSQTHSLCIKCSFALMNNVSDTGWWTTLWQLKKTPPATIERQIHVLGGWHWGIHIFPLLSVFTSSLCDWDL